MMFMIALAAAAATHLSAKPAASLHFTVDMTNRQSHTFDVTLKVDSLAPANAVFEFAATAPGTYQVMDMGRYVRSFTAYDANGREIPAEHISVNQWKLSNPRAARTIHYTIVATRDTAVKEHVVYPMCGTALRDDYAQINGQAVFGFPHGMQAAPIGVILVHPSDWIVGTALPLSNGEYQAESYDQLVDSPFLLGSTITTTAVNVTGVPVRIFVHSAKGLERADSIGVAMTGMLTAAGRFLGRLPVNRYAFLFDFGPQSAGAWEHSYSSEYVLIEAPYTPTFGARVTDIAAHEFFHVVTPLNIHSEIIEHFNFETPVPSQHLWLYEGTTEWAAHKMQLEAKLKTPEQYLATLAGKIRSDRTAFDTTYSLTKLALTSYTDEGQRQYGNIYQRGAIVAGLLDIQLLEQSKGKHGLRDLVLELAKEFGAHRSFRDADLFNYIEKHTSRATGDFMRKYIQNAEHLPIEEYYAKLGIRTVVDDKGIPAKFEIDPNPTPSQLRLRKAWLGQPLK